MFVQFAKRMLFAGATAFMLSMSSAVPASAIVFDLQSDFSTTLNPNGPWSYTAGGVLLPSVADWSTMGPGFAVSGTSGFGFAPSIFRFDGAGSEPIDASTGNIVVHTNTNDTNQGNGELRIRFIVPVSGFATISGAIWDAHLSVDRDQSWALSVNGAVQTQGVVVGDGTNGSSNPDSISLLPFFMNAGDEVWLDLTRFGGDNGGLLGLNLNINLDPAAVPGPSVGAGLPGLAIAFGGFIAWWRRKRATEATA